MNCKDCKHFKKRETLNCVILDTNKNVKIVLGNCNKIDKYLIIEDDSDYLVIETFGCILFESKEEVKEESNWQTEIGKD